MDEMRKGEEERAKNIIGEKLMEAVPMSWALSKWTVNTSNFGLPQSRQRHYFIGRDVNL